MQRHSHPNSSPHRRAAGSGGSPSSLLGLGLLVALCLGSCASVNYERETETSGRFASSGIAVTLLTIDLPQRAIDIARENASDAGLPNMVIEDVTIFPNLGPFDWLLDIFSIRYARISGHWGYEK